MTDDPRIRLVTRRPEEVGAALQAWFARHLPAGSEPVVHMLDAPVANGMSSDTVLFDLEAGQGGSRSRRPCVARMEPEAAAVPVFPTYDLARQVRVMRLAARAPGVPVPAAPWSEPDPGPLGSPFFVMDRVAGRVPPDVLPYNFGSWLSEADPADQARLQEATVGVLASLHRLDADLGFLQLDAPGPTALARHLADQRRYYGWVAADGGRVPLLERCLAHLEERWPVGDATAVLSWGDARIGNVVYDGFEPAGVLDWEMAAVGPPELDLAWLVFLHRFFEDIAADAGLPGMPGFLRLDDVVAAYERLGGRPPVDLEGHLLYAALRHGVVMARVQQRLIRTGQAQPPDDPDDLVMHRRALEAMLAGTYWRDL